MKVYRARRAISDSQNGYDIRVGTYIITDQVTWVKRMGSYMLQEVYGGEASIPKTGEVIRIIKSVESKLTIPVKQPDPVEDEIKEDEDVKEEKEDEKKEKATTPRRRVAKRATTKVVLDSENKSDDNGE